MKQILLIVVLCSFNSMLFSQSKMRPIEALINKTEPAWKLVKEWIKNAKNKVEVLPIDSVNAKDALYKTQVTTRSPMGAIVYETGGILIDNGWIRILGSGSKKLNRSLPYWNKGKSFREFGDSPSFFLIADDVIGGFFILNGGGLGKESIGKVFYLAPDNLLFEPLDLNYSEFINFCLAENLEKFYSGNKWNSWKTDISKLSGDSVFAFYPFLWSKEGKDINKNTRGVISIEEQYTTTIIQRKQLKLDK
jgi:hypothetical protein